MSQSKPPQKATVVVKAVVQRLNEETGKPKVKEDKRCLGPNMGAGTKYDFTAEGNRYKANPASYSIPSVFDMNKFKAKGVGFRVSRNQARQNSYMKLTENPGPGKHGNPEKAPLSEFTKLPAYSIPKQKNSTKQSDTPAPNSYNQTITYSNSKHGFKGNTIIQPPTTLRFEPTHTAFTTLTSEYWKTQVKQALQITNSQY